jgi:hypothetical protein
MARAEEEESMTFQDWVNCAMFGMLFVIWWDVRAIRKHFDPDSW